ncbi:MAG: hypothetical protein RM338_17790 [Nostoc sp. DedQUE12a]|nr:hypothetical protein [Nostoc sp. DedQUE12a]
MAMKKDTNVEYLLVRVNPIWGVNGDLENNLTHSRTERREIFTKNLGLL